MNFENYNKIYQEILDDDKNELSANYLLNKYEIKYDEELINILNQIKKNEYISSENNIINRLLKELDEDEDLLDVNEIIDIKEKVITKEIFDNIDVEDEIEQKTIFDKENYDKVKKESKKDNFNINNLNNLIVDLNFKKAIPFLIIFIVFIGIFTLYNTFEDKKETVDYNVIAKNENKDIDKKEDEKNIVSENEIKIEEDSTNTKIADTEDINQIEPEIQPQELISKDTITEELIQTNQEEEKKELTIQNTAKIDNINDIDTKIDTIVIYDENDIKADNIKENPEEIVQQTLSKNPPASNGISLNSINELENYQNDFSYKDGNLIFENQAYKEEDFLFGFKIYKLTPIYVKFQDEKNHMRKRILFKN